MRAVVPSTRREGAEMTTEREKALGLAIGQIERAFGKGAIMCLGGVEDAGGVGG